MIQLTTATTTMFADQCGLLVANCIACTQTKNATCRWCISPLGVGTCISVTNASLCGGNLDAFCEQFTTVSSAVGVSIGEIVGIVLGSIAFIGLIVIATVAVFTMHRSKKKQANDAASAGELSSGATAVENSSARKLDGKKGEGGDVVQPVQPHGVSPLHDHKSTSRYAVLPIVATQSSVDVHNATAGLDSIPRAPYARVSAVAITSR
jgi:hypothetical protein